MKKRYKKSQYNYVCKTQTGYLIYNTLYNSLSRLSEDEYEYYMSGKLKNKEVLQSFLEQGIFVDGNIDELERYNLYSRYAREYIELRPNITVTPTMECNARCFYCYEEGVRCGKMKDSDAKKIVQFIKTLDYSKGIELTWFGGEPLMNQAWMDTLSEQLRAENIEFSSFIITNGSLIKDDILTKMVNQWNIKSIQITLDGCVDEYALRKAYIDQDENIYYKILRDIGKLTKVGIEVQIRMNIDRNNTESILQAVEDIHQLYKSNPKVKCYPAFLTGTKTPMSEREKIDFIKRMIEVSEGIFDVNEILYKYPRTMACYYNQSNAYSIDAQGDVFICEHMLGHSKQAIGNIKNIANIERRIREVAGQRIECQKCVFLPKCYGGCIDTYNSGESPCFTDKYIIKAYLELL